MSADERHIFSHQGRTVYEWDQNLSEVNLYLKVPAGVKAKDLYIDLTADTVRIGLRPNPPYLKGTLGARIKADESFWTLDGCDLHIQLGKAKKRETWSSALAGHNLDQSEQEGERKRLLLERFQEEYAGFDFRGAEFSGEIPDPSTFMTELN